MANSAIRPVRMGWGAEQLHVNDLQTGVDKSEERGRVAEKSARDRDKLVRANLDDDHPNLAAFLQRMRARPEYQAALERGGPYALLAGSTKK